MLYFKGRLWFKQYLPSKPSDKWGVKVWSLCDSKTGFLCKLDVYTGNPKDPFNSIEPLGERVVLNLTKGCMRNFEVKQKRPPIEMRPQSCKMKKGDEPKFWVNADESIVTCTWQDIGRVNLFSTELISDTESVQNTGKGSLFIFNPFTGQPTSEGLVKLGFRIKQSSLLHQPNKEFLRGVLLLDDSNNIHVFPESTREVAHNIAASTFLFTGETNGTLTGYALTLSPSEHLLVTEVWKLHIDQPTIEVVGKNPMERVHSQGRVLGDRSVLYKYVNPNLVAVVTQAPDPVHKYLLSIFLVDVVSGAVVFSVVHKRAKGPVHLVHSENWLVYSLFNDKFRRTEVVALELYEGKTQSNTTAFSSVLSPIQPIVDRQAFILPATVEAMKETITEKGITSKHILVALSTGGVVELPWVFLDPRRPFTLTPEMREEGVIPYMPELPIPSESIINYNQTLMRIQGIHTSPSGLESTSLVLVYGLDLFYTRVAPSKTFDVLKEDFDYFLITVVLTALLLASYVTKKLSSKKALKQAWNLAARKIASSRHQHSGSAFDSATTTTTTTTCEKVNNMKCKHVVVWPWWLHA
uniref:ER membrane protein complex subunit 1 n=1 Tax=Timema monikensis TaxID=170555 RepID=A0A7R9E9H0_9NEOP|nr:unnamed protein product [Timema monikensis]